MMYPPICPCRIEGLRCGGEEFRAEVGGGDAADEVNQTAATRRRRRIRMGTGIERSCKENPLNVIYYNKV